MKIYKKYKEFITECGEKWKLWAMIHRYFDKLIQQDKNTRKEYELDNSV